MIRTYLTIENMYKDINNTEVETPYKIVPQDDIFWLFGRRFNKIFTGYTNANTLWLQYICPKYWDSAIAYTDEMNLGDTVTPVGAYDRFLNRCVQWLISTSVKYDKILESYEAMKTKLLDTVKVSNSGSTKYNDTPQGGTNDFTGDNYTSTYTEVNSSNESDAGTAIERLKEIDDGWKDVMNDWCNEFKQFIIESD